MTDDGFHEITALRTQLAEVTKQLALAEADAAKERAERKAMIATLYRKEEAIRAALGERDAVLCKATFGSKGCAMVAGHTCAHTSRSGSSWAIGTEDPSDAA